MPVISDFKKSYGEKTVLSIDSLKIKKGETLAVTGPNGSGKSTLLKILTGLITPDSGAADGFGKVLYMPQSSYAFSMSVEKNVMYAMTGDGKAERAKKILELLGLYDLRERNAKKLSGGETQRLALARLLVCECDTLLLDEPSGAVDIDGTDTVWRAIEEYQKENGCTVIFSTHSPFEAKKHADRIILLHNGEIIEDDSSADFFKTQKSEWGKKFIAQFSVNSD
ncbi:MAG: ABC transporter ATP-binding protein [Acutalibacteraceae bacterium]